MGQLTVKQRAGAAVFPCGGAADGRAPHPNSGAASTVLAWESATTLVSNVGFWVLFPPWPAELVSEVGDYDYGLWTYFLGGFFILTQVYQPFS